MIRKILLSLPLSTALTWAIDPNFIKGSESLMHPDKTEMTPVNAATMLETGWLENLRLLWNVGLKESIEPYAQLKGTEVDNPHSQTALLLQYLFPSPDGAALALNNREFFPLKGLSHKQLGEVYALADVGVSPEKYMRANLERNRRPEGARLATTILFAFNEDKTQFIQNLARHCFIAYILKAAESKEQIWDFLVAAKLTNIPTAEKRQNFLSDQFAPSLYDEFKSSMNRVVIDPREQDKRTSYLEAFLTWEQSRIDAGTLSIYRNGRRILKVPSIDNFLAPERAWAKLQPTRKTYELLDTNKETAYFLGHTYARTEKDRFIVEYGVSSWQEGSFKFNFSDCAEAAIFSILNGALFDPTTRRPNAGRIPETAIPQLSALYRSIENSPKPLAAFRPQFSSLISNIDDLDYVRTTPSGGRYELASNIRNVKQALIYLLGLDTDTEDENLFSVFNSATSTFTLSDTSECSLEILKNNNPWLSLKSSGNHTKLKSHEPDIEWGHQISRKMLENRYHNRKPAISFIYPALFESKFMWRILATAEETTPTHHQLLTTALSLPLRGTGYHMKLLNQSLGHTPHTQDALSSLTGITAKALLDDQHTASGVLRLIASIGHERIKATPFANNLYTLFIRQCQKSPIFAWAGFLYWQDPDLKPYLSQPLRSFSIENMLELTLHTKVFMELFVGVQSSEDDIAPTRFMPALPKSQELQQLFLKLWEQLIQQDPDYQNNIAPEVIEYILEELLSNLDLTALKKTLILAKNNNIRILFSYIHQQLLTHKEAKDFTDLILESAKLPNTSDDISPIEDSFFNPAITDKIRLKILDKICDENIDLLSILGIPTDRTLLERILTPVNDDFCYQVFVKIRQHSPTLLINMMICNIYASYTSSFWSKEMQRITYAFRLTTEQREDVRQFITEYKDEFKALYDSKETTPELIREILY